MKLVGTSNDNNDNIYMVDDDGVRYNIANSSVSRGNSNVSGSVTFIAYPKYSFARNNSDRIIPKEMWGHNQWK